MLFVNYMMHMLHMYILHVCNKEQLLLRHLSVRLIIVSLLSHFFLFHCKGSLSTYLLHIITCFIRLVCLPTFFIAVVSVSFVSILISHLIHNDVDSSILLLLNNLNLAAFKLSYKISNGNTFK